MNAEALQRLEDRVRTLDGVRARPGTGDRDNEPLDSWAPDDPAAVNALIERGGFSREARVLNLDTCRGIGPASRSEVITGLDGLVLELEPERAITEARALRGGQADTPGPREVAARVLDLSPDQARVLFDGPNWAGTARAWVQPHEAAQAVQHVRRDMPLDRVWAHLDREALVEQHGRERPDAYLEPEVRDRVESWLQGVDLEGYDPDSGLTVSDFSDVDLAIERVALLEQLRSNQSWDSISASADIDWTAHIGRGVVIEDLASVGRDAYIGVDVHLGVGVSVGDGAHVERGVSVMDGSVVGDRSQVAVSLGPGVTVGQECVLQNRGQGDSGYVPGGTEVPDRTIAGHYRPEPEWPTEAAPPPAQAPEPARGSSTRSRGSRDR